MKVFDPHVHMTSRTTNDYEAMAAAGIVAIVEPAFWLGQPRTNAGSYMDYLSSLVGWERFRAAQFGIRHYCAIGLNAKEANNEALAEEVLAVDEGVLPIHVPAPTVKRADETLCATVAVAAIGQKNAAVAAGVMKRLHTLLCPDDDD